MQERLGKDGNIIKVYKIRTMVYNADKDIPDNILKGELKGKDNRTISSRIWLRKTGIDEIPQIINILKGEMSFFGTRPLMPIVYKNLTKQQQKRWLKYKPGIFGGYAFVNKGKNKKRTIRENQDVYLRLRYIKQKQSSLEIYKFNTYILWENIKAILKGINC